MTRRELSREKQALIVADLARGSRTAGPIARRHGVTEQVVLALRAAYGPDLGSLTTNAQLLRRPAPVTVAAKPVVHADSEAEPEHALSAPVSRGLDGLTRSERAECRAWALANGIAAGSGGRVAAAVVEAWEAAGRPILDGVAPVLATSACADGHLHGEGGECADADSEPTTVDPAECDDTGPADADEPVDEVVTTPSERTATSSEAPVATDESDAGADEELVDAEIIHEGHLMLREAIAAGEFVDVLGHAADHYDEYYVGVALDQLVTAYEQLRDAVAEARHDEHIREQLSRVMAEWAQENDLTVSAYALREVASRVLEVVA